MFSILRKLRNDEKGASAIEYVLLVVIVSVGIITGFQTLKNNINTKFNQAASSIATAS